MKGNLLRSFVLAFGFLVVCSAVLAHHGTSAYANRLTEFKQATVTKFLWSNPHSLLYFDVKDEKGDITHWVGETGSPSALAPIGWSKKSVEPGDVITVFIFPSKTGNPAGRLNHIVLPDGTKLQDTYLGEDRHPE